MGCCYLSGWIFQIFDGARDDGERGDGGGGGERKERSCVNFRCLISLVSVLALPLWAHDLTYAVVVVVAVVCDATTYPIDGNLVCEPDEMLQKLF